jgi:hypothetical protein
MIRMNRRRYLKGMLLAGGALAKPAFAMSEAGVNLSYDETRDYVLRQGGTLPPDEVRILGGYLGEYLSPAGRMGQAGGWTAVYDVLGYKSDKKTKGPLMSNVPLGQVSISRKKDASEYRIHMHFRPLAAVEEVSALIRCRPDELRSIREYELSWTSSAAMPYVRREAGVVESGGFRVAAHGGAEFFSTQRPLVSLWTLMDAVRFLPASNDRIHEMDLYMDLSCLRRDQRLRYVRSGEIQTAAGGVPVRFYEQTGIGIQPIHYAVDETNRMLFVTQGQLAWGLNRIEKG